MAERGLERKKPPKLAVRFGLPQHFEREEMRMDIEKVLMVISASGIAIFAVSLILGFVVHVIKN